MAPSIPAALERVVGKALNKVPEERYETARQMQSALFSIRAALSGATDTTERLSLRWTPIPSAVLRLVTHAPIKWRAAALTALMVTALVLLYVSRSPSPVAAPPDAELTSATLDQLLTYPVPVHLNAALVAQRDSALAARERARRAGAMKNNVSSLILAETVVQNAERALRTGDLARASSGYWSAIPQYAKAQVEAETLRRDAERAIARATPVVHALATRPEAGRAATSLARADSLYLAMDYVVSRLAALDAEQVGVAAGVAPPSPQPPETRAAIAVLLQDLERAVSSERVGNLQVLMPGMAPKDVAAWQGFFQLYTRVAAQRHRLLEVAPREGELLVAELHAVDLPHPIPQRQPQAVAHHAPACHLIAELRGAVASHHDVADLLVGLGLPFSFEPGAGTRARMCRLGREPGSDPEQEHEQTGVSNRHERPCQRPRIKIPTPAGGWTRSRRAPPPPHP